MKILVTGGLGFIGSHTVVEMMSNNIDVIIADNLSNSKIDILNKIEIITGRRPVFYQIDVTDDKNFSNIFKENIVEGIVHFAGLKAVGESVLKPVDYYYNNLLSVINVCKMSVDYSIKKIVFSSSATVYGDQPSPIKEDSELKKTTNPYGETKIVSERILSDFVKVNPEISLCILRYFNPVGAHKSGLLGENPVGVPNNLMPYLTKVAKGELAKLSVFGNDYDTIDGTCIRDYLHVVDLALGHVNALKKMKKGIKIYNLGTGSGYSVLQIIEAFKRVNTVEVPYEFSSRRQGDIAVCFADVEKAERELGWKARLTIEDMVRDSWNYEKNNN